MKRTFKALEKVAGAICLAAALPANVNAQTHYWVNVADGRTVADTPASGALMHSAGLVTSHNIQLSDSVDAAAVSEPPTVMAGLLLLAPIAVSMLGLLRRRWKRRG